MVRAHGRRAGLSNVEEISSDSVTTEEVRNSALGDGVNYINPLWFARSDAIILDERPVSAESVYNVAVSGSGSADFRGSNGDVILSTGSVSGSSVLIERGVSGAGQYSATWQKDRAFRCAMQVLDDTSDRTDTVSTGQLSASQAGFGFRLSGGSLKAVSNDGTSETSTEIIPSSNISTGDEFLLRAELNSSVPEIEFFSGGTLLETITSNVPVGQTDRPNVLLRSELSNSVAADRRQVFRWAITVQEP